MRGKRERPSICPLITRTKIATNMHKGRKQKMPQQDLDLPSFIFLFDLTYGAYLKSRGKETHLSNSSLTPHPKSDASHTAPKGRQREDRPENASFAPRRPFIILSSGRHSCVPILAKVPEGGRGGRKEGQLPPPPPTLLAPGAFPSLPFPRIHCTESEYAAEHVCTCTYVCIGGAAEKFIVSPLRVVLCIHHLLLSGGIIHYLFFFFRFRLSDYPLSLLSSPPV